MTAYRDEILRNLRTVRAEIDAACDRAGRHPSEVLLVAAAKSVPAEVVAWIVDLV